jgi:hypothetical protein
LTSDPRRQRFSSDYYDLCAWSAVGQIAEHWDTIETIPPRSEWKNANGKF